MAERTIEPLPHGYKLNEYLIDRRIGGGGFGVVYLAYDATGEPVAIKEYLPDGLARRIADGRVEPLGEAQVKPFRHGMKYFFDEGRALANIQHPNVVRVTNFFRANDTVYMVMRYERGKTLQRMIQELRGEPMREAFIRRVFVQLLNGLREVHAQKLLHLDIKPSNIYVRQDGSPVLLDFGAARQASFSDAGQITPMYTPGFAAPEQYHRRDRLGPWTDIYAIGASLFACMAGCAPPSAPEREQKDELADRIKPHARRYSAELIELVAAMLRLNYLERPQSVFSIQKRLIELRPVKAWNPPSALDRIKRAIKWPW